MNKNLELAVRAGCLLGEGTVWGCRSRNLLFTEENSAVDRTIMVQIRLQ